MYQMATQPADKAAFLKAFEENGGGRNTESLKFAWSYTSEISASKEKEHGIHEGLFTRPFFVLFIRTRDLEFQLWLHPISWGSRIGSTSRSAPRASTSNS